MSRPTQKGSPHWIFDLLHYTCLEKTHTGWSLISHLISKNKTVWVRTCANNALMWQCCYFRSEFTCMVVGSAQSLILVYEILQQSKKENACVFIVGLLSEIPFQCLLLLLTCEPLQEKQVTCMLSPFMATPTLWWAFSSKFHLGNWVVRKNKCLTHRNDRGTVN